MCGEEISWGEVEMRLHLGSLREIGAVRDRECVGRKSVGEKWR